MILSVILHPSCDRLGAGGESGTGWLRISFVKGGELFTKVYRSLPDTSDFLLKITDSGGKIVYEGKYGDCPENVELAKGNYTVKVISSQFSKPAFDSPQFGDEQCVFVPESGVCSVKLLCSQLNAGIRLEISSAFLSACPDAVLFLKSSDGKLMYSYSEKRTAYFSPGPVSLVMSSAGVDEVVMVRELQAREMLTLSVNAPLTGLVDSYGMSVSVDTSRVWITDECVIGGGDSGGDSSNALNVSQARSSAGTEDVWVNGYIVGGDLTSASASFQSPFKSRTNILLGPRSATKDKNSCLSIQLPEGKVREAVNLVDNPELLGKRICLKGDVVSAYFGIPGMKNTDDYKIY